MTTPLSLYQEQFLQDTRKYFLNNEFLIEKSHPKSNSYRLLNMGSSFSKIQDAGEKIEGFVQDLKGAFQEKKPIIIYNFIEEAAHEDFMQWWINCTPAPTWNDFKDLYSLCWSNIGMSHMIDWVEDSTYLLELVAFRPPSIAGATAESEMTLLTDTIHNLERKMRFSHEKPNPEGLFSAIQKCLDNYKNELLTLKNPQTEEWILYKIKHTLPDMELTGLIPYLPNLPQKNQSTKGLFEIVENPVVQVNLSKTEIFNNFANIMTHNQLDYVVNFMLETLRESPLSGIGLVESNPTNSLDHVKLFIGSTNTEAPPVEKVLHLLDRTLETINGLGNIGDLKSHKDFISASIHKSWLDINMPKKSKVKRSKI